jgi:molecular chaperone GrpE
MKHNGREDTTRRTGPVEPDEGASQAEAPTGPATEVAPEATPESPESESPAEDREAALAAELADTKDRMLRALAEIENLRRRTARELEEARKYAITGFARELLEVDDNLSRALDSIPRRAADEIGFVKTLAEGIGITQKALAACFERHQIAKVTPEIGEKFDHNRHQAMFEVESDQPPGTIAQVLQPGYVIADRLLRPALVGVAKAPATQAAEPDGAGAPSAARVDRRA